MESQMASEKYFKIKSQSKSTYKVFHFPPEGLGADGKRTDNLGMTV